VHKRARNTFSQLIDSGNRPNGVMIMSTDPAVMGIYGAAGYDFAVVDREHGIMDISHMLAHITMARSMGIVPFVRVLENNGPLIQQALDSGAEGIIVPKVGTAEAARRAVLATRYAPGGRGFCPVVNARNFSLRDFGSYSAEMNSNVLLLPLIETMQGVDNIDEICSVEGVDYLYFGLADLSQDLGLDMFGDAARLIELWEQVVAAARRHDVRVGAPLGYGFDPLADFGTIDADLPTLRTAAERGLAQFARPVLENA
jgi:2-keto-3-deoxy-L-rhamnonate aldolase RhmA